MTSQERQTMKFYYDYYSKDPNAFRAFILSKMDEAISKSLMLNILGGVPVDGIGDGLRYAADSHSDLILGGKYNKARQPDAVFSAATIVAPDAFKNNMNLERVMLPYCHTIMDGAFDGCSNLKEVIIPSVKIIGKKAFRGTAVEELDMPNCEALYHYSLANCRSLKMLNIPACKKFAFTTLFNALIQEENVNISPNAKWLED